MRNVSHAARTAVWAVGIRRSGGKGITTEGAPYFRYLAPSGTENGLYAQPGEVIPGSATWSVSGNTIVRDGRVSAFLPTAASGRRIEVRGSCPTRVELCATVSYARRIAPGRESVLDFAMPAVPVAAQSPVADQIRALSFFQAHAAVRASWQRTLAPAMRIRLPEKSVEDAYYASLTQILDSRYELAGPGGGGGPWVQTVNDLQYHAFWLRDGAIMTNALDLAGLHTAAAQDLSYFASWQQPDGLFISRTRQYDGMGQALWAIGRHAELTGDANFARSELPAISRAVSWIAQQIALDPLGLMPISAPGDDEYATGHLAGDDFWAVAGMDAALELAMVAGQPELAASWTALDGALRANVARATRAAAAANGGAVPPTLDQQGGLDWGNWWVAYPDGPLGLYDPIVTATIAAADAGLREGIATYDDGRLLHDYLGFRIFETQLERGDQAPVVAALYSEIAHSSGTYGGFETSIAPLGKRSSASNLSPHGTYSGELVTLLRNMLVRDDGSRVYLLSAIPTAWLEPGDITAVSQAPTTRGRVSLRLSAHAGGATLTWSAPGSIGAPVWAVPYGVSDFHASAGTRSGRALILPSTSGHLEVTWKLGRARTLADTVASLRTAYASHGAPFPPG